MDRSTKQKINKETQTLNDTMDLLELINTCRTFHPKQSTAPFSQVHTEPSPEYITSWAITCLFKLSHAQYIQHERKNVNLLYCSQSENTNFPTEREINIVRLS